MEKKYKSYIKLAREFVELNSTTTEFTSKQIISFITNRMIADSVPLARQAFVIKACANLDILSRQIYNESYFDN